MGKLYLGTSDTIYLIYGGFYISCYNNLKLLNAFDNGTAVQLSNNSNND